MLSAIHVRRCCLDKRSDTKNLPPQKTDNILYNCSHKGSHEPLPTFGYRLGCFISQHSSVRTPLLAKWIVIVGKMCTQPFTRRQREGKSDGSRLHTSRLSSICTFTTSLVPECDSWIFAVWPFHATHLLIRPFLLPPHTRSLARTHTQRPLKRFHYRLTIHLTCERLSK